MKYLRKFETEADVNMSVTPNVVLVGDTGKVIYNVLNGVYIQHIDGSLYTTDEWTASGFANDQANGVAVASALARFVIAKTDIAYSGRWSTNMYKEVSGVLLTSDKDTAKTDFAGYNNTQLMLATDTSGAGYYCANFTFPNGNKGYLPALGEWVLAHSYKSAVDNAMSLIGGTVIPNKNHWSSTQYDAYKAWWFYWGSGAMSDYSKDTSYAARPFTTL